MAIKLADKVFLATAAHLVKRGHEYEIVVPNALNNPTDPFAATYLDADSDVAALEVMEADRRFFLHKHVEETSLLTQLPGDLEYSLLVIGFPGEYLECIGRIALSETDSVLMVAANAFSLSAEPMPFDEWPKHGLDRPSNTQRDLFLKYDPEDKLRVLGDSDTGVVPQAVHKPDAPMRGISGGAVWLKLIGRTPKRHPSPRLVGLQVSGGKRGGWLRATLIDCWLDLVLRNYPDLTDAISRIRSQAI